MKFNFCTETQVLPGLPHRMTTDAEGNIVYHYRNVPEEYVVRMPRETIVKYLVGMK